MGFSIWIYVFGFSRCNGLIKSYKNSYAIQFFNAWMFVVNNLYTNWQSISGFLLSSCVSLGVSNVICDIIFYFNTVLAVKGKWQTPKNNCDNYVPQWWVEFDDELSWLFTNRFRATRYMKVKRMGITKFLAIFCE